MLKHFRSGKRALFRNVPDNKKRNSAAFGYTHNFGCAFSNLPDRTRRGRKVVRINRLNTVYNAKLHAVKLAIKSVYAGFVNNQHIVGFQIKPFRSHFNLRTALLRRKI